MPVSNSYAGLTIEALKEITAVSITPMFGATISLSGLFDVQRTYPHKVYTGNLEVLMAYQDLARKSATYARTIKELSDLLLSRGLTSERINILTGRSPGWNGDLRSGRMVWLCLWVVESWALRIVQAAYEGINAEAIIRRCTRGNEKKGSEQQPSQETPTHTTLPQEVRTGIVVQTAAGQRRNRKAKAKGMMERRRRSPLELE